MKNVSIWKSSVKQLNHSKLRSDTECDVLIIGGGITGVSTLYHLSSSNLKTILVEQNKIGWSVTGNNTGKLNYLQNDLIDKIRKNYNDEVASLYLKSQIKTINNIVKTIKDKKIDCDLKKVNTYLYTNKESEAIKLMNLRVFLEKNGIKTIKKSLDYIDNKYSFCALDTYVLNPIKLLYGLIRVNDYIYEDTCIRKIIKNQSNFVCYTNECKIRAKWVVLASHYPYFNIPFLFPLKASLEKSYISFSKSNINNISLINYSSPFKSFASYKNGLIYLSNNHSSCNKVDESKNFNLLLNDLNKLKLSPLNLWSNIDIMTSDGLPYIGVLKEKMLIGTGYNTWGLTNGFLAGKILSDIILNRNNEYISLFDPNRFNQKIFWGSFINAFKSISGYISGLKMGTYTCPHMGCKLIYNIFEKTWDCPCHGSRFDENGKCISSPSNRNISLKK